MLPSSLLRSQCRRGYGSVASKRPLRAKGPVLGLEHFIQRKRAIGLWREIVRSINKVSSPSTREELRQFARAEFELNRAVTDITQIRYLISTGKSQFDTMKRYVDENAPR